MSDVVIAMTALVSFATAMASMLIAVKAIAEIKNILDRLDMDRKDHEYEVKKRESRLVEPTREEAKQYGRWPQYSVIGMILTELARGQDKRSVLYIAKLWLVFSVLVMNTVAFISIRENYYKRERENNNSKDIQKLIVEVRDLKREIALMKSEKDQPQ